MIERGPGTGYKRGEDNHSTRHSDRKVECARMLMGYGFGDVYIAELLNVGKTTVQNWREGRMRNANSVFL